MRPPESADPEAGSLCIRSPSSSCRRSTGERRPAALDQTAAPALVAPDGDDWLHEIKLDGYHSANQARADALTYRRNQGDLDCDRWLVGDGGSDGVSSSAWTLTVTVYISPFL